MDSKMNNCIPLTNAPIVKNPFKKPVQVYTYYANGKLLYAGLKGSELSLQLSTARESHWSNRYTYCFVETLASRLQAVDKVNKLNRRIK